MSHSKKKIHELKFDEKNINKGTEYGNALLEKSLREVGAGRSILIDKNGVIIAGNQTAAKAGELGIEDVIVVPTDGKSLIAVQRMDIDINSPDGAKMKILDNTVSKHNYIEDAEVMEAICEEYEIEQSQYGLSKPANYSEKNKEVDTDEFDNASFTIKLEYTAEDYQAVMDAIKEKGQTPERILYDALISV